MLAAVRRFLLGKGRLARSGVGTNPKGREMLAFVVDEKMRPVLNRPGYF